jgi:2-polyprenyl-3-methyl-5-hydroxy-6-metoxy-1,4-benzoquinol methylase
LNAMNDEDRGMAECRMPSQSGAQLAGQRAVKSYRRAKFWDWIAARYARTPVADEASYQKKLQITQGYLRPGMEVLEFGCGTGTTALIHAPHVKHIRAIDISSRMIEIARGKAEASQAGNISFDQSSFDDLYAPDRSFDAVLGLSILHLLENRDAAIAKVYRLLTPGGIFVSSTACIGDGMKWFKLVAPIGKLFGHLPLVKVFTSEELVASLVNAGFVIDHRWQPARGKAVFIVARRPA